MSEISTFDRLLAMLRRLSPPWPSTEEDTNVGRELGSIASALTLAADRLDDIWEELFPDSASETLARWEYITRTPVRSADEDATRQARILSVLRREAGTRTDQLAAMLATVLDIDADDIEFDEQLRSEIEDGLLYDTGAISVTVPSVGSVELEYHSRLPSTVDDFGVKVWLEMTDGLSTWKLISPAGTEWDLEDLDGEWQQDRETFRGETASGIWRLRGTGLSLGANTITLLKLLISDDTDSRQIYNFYAFRDPLIAGTPNLAEAQRLFHRTALGHMRSFITQSESFIVDDEFSLVDRDPVGV